MVDAAGWPRCVFVCGGDEGGTTPVTGAKEQECTTLRQRCGDILTSRNGACGDNATSARTVAAAGKRDAKPKELGGKCADWLLVIGDGASLLLMIPSFWSRPPSNRDAMGGATTSDTPELPCKGMLDVVIGD